MPRAQTTLVIYRPDTYAIVAEMKTGERYMLAETDLLYHGTLANFKIENPEYKMLQDIVNETINKLK